jgi:hypothetical protein
MAFFAKFLGAKSNAIGDNGWTARMGWRYIKYIESENFVSFQIEPMTVGADLVYIPNTETWLRNAPDWAKQKAAEIINRLKSVQWNRELQWIEDPNSVFQISDNAVPGSLESTPGGSQLESGFFFHPGAKMSFPQARQVWCMAARKFAEAARGRVTIFQGGVIPNSVFQQIELPALRSNVNVTLDLK